MEQRLSIITLGVSNIAKLTEFYENVFGWRKLPTSNERITFFELNGLLLGLYGRAELAEDAGVPATGQGFEGLSLAYNTRTKEEVDALVATLEAKGARVVKRPKEVFWGGYSSYIADPDGHLWEIAFNPYLQLDKQGNVI